MTCEDKLRRAAVVLQTLRLDAQQALSGVWDKSDQGFQDQIAAIDAALDAIEGT